MADLGIARPQDLLAGVAGTTDAMASRRVPEHGEGGRNAFRRRPREIGAAAAPAESAVDAAALKEKIDRLNQSAREYHLRFEVSDTFGRVIVHVVDEETGEILRTVPPASVLNLQDRLSGEAGLLVDAES